MITFKELKKILRTDYVYYIRPLVIKDKCKSCGCEENLVVHHDKEFSILLDETLEELNLYKLEFNEDEVAIIRTHMLGKQIQIKNITLCNKCHTEQHREKGSFSSTGKHTKMNKIKEMKRKKEKEIELQKKKKEKELQKKEEELKKLQKIKELKEYLETLVGKKLYKEDREELIEKLNLRDNYNRLQKKISTLNDYLSDNYNMMLISKRVKEKGKLVTVWILNNKI